MSPTITVATDELGAVTLTIRSGSRGVTVRVTPERAQRLAAELLIASGDDELMRRDEQGRYVDA